MSMDGLNRCNEDGSREFVVTVLDDGSVEVFTHFDSAELVQLMIDVFNDVPKLYEVFNRAFMIHQGRTMNFN